MANLHLLTFGDGSPQNRGAATRLQKEASQARIFATTNVYNLKRIRDEYPAFWKQHGRFLLTAPRGLGYYLWKVFLVTVKLGELRENDFLAYLDAGCEITSRNAGNLLDLLPTEPGTDLSVVPLEPFHTTARWTNNYCLSHLDKSRAYLDRPMISATFMFLRNTAASRLLCARWLEWATFEDHGCLVDRPGDTESAEFEHHKDDQSIFNLLVYDLEQRGAIGVKRIDLEKTQRPESAIHGVRNRTPFRLTGTNGYKRRILSKCFSAAVRFFWDEKKYRADLYESLQEK